MNIKYKHIILLFLILGIFSFQSLELDELSNSNLFLEIENEEEIDEISECDFEKEISFSIADDDGGSAAIFEPFIVPQHTFEEFQIVRSYTKYCIQKSNLFILYCCLKIDC